MKLNSRTKAIIEHLLKSENYITYDDLGKKLDVSSRTISREMKEVEDWFISNNVELVKKQRKGLIVDAVGPVKLKLLESLASSSIYKIYTQKERLDFILLELVQDEEPIKQFYFSSLLNVSEATISHDLDKIGPMLEEYSLMLVRKPGVGIYLEGPEVQKRQLLTSILYQYYDKEQLFNMTKNEIVQPSSKQQLVGQSKDRLLGMVDKETLVALEEIVNEASTVHNYALTDISKVGLIVHLAIYIQRIRKNESISIDPELLDMMKSSDEYALAEKISSQVAKKFDVKVPESENGYITMHLKGARVEAFTDNKEYIFSNFELVRMTNNIISAASNQTGIDLSKDQQLFIGLITHLKPVLIRLKLSLTIRNPMLEDIKRDYSHYFELAKLCQKGLEIEMKTAIPDEETAFIAMHLGSAVERLKGSKKRKLRVIVTCTTGIGSSRMLTARLSQEFREFDIVETLASPSIKSDELKAKGIDLIISTIAGVDFDIPSIVVTPILSKKDIQIITDYISKIDIKLVEPDEIIEKQDAILDAKDPRGKISEINLYSAKVLSIIDNVDYKELALSTIDDVIEDYSSMFDDKIAKNTRHALRKREKIGSTIIRKHNILLLHAKVKNFEQVKVAVLNPKHEIRYKDALIKSIVVLLIDKKAADIEIELVSQVSKNLIVNEKFINAVKSLDKSLFVQEISNLMYNFLYNKFTREVD